MNFMSMNEFEMREFLSKKRLARLATVKKNGTPQITPVWFDYDGKYFWVTARKERHKVANLRRNPNVALTIDREERPYQGIIVEGKAELSEERLEELVRKTARKYCPPPEDAEKIASDMLTFPRITIKIVPEKIITWDNVKTGKS
jgi:PPOX class probable F420-dependent enzyme